MSEPTSAPAQHNALAGETSPYLLQHARNPVQWHPWSEQALTLARETGRPILLSVGYSACHWCHVMAHESFEDEETARLMNEHFVNIKVDREERPDLDRIYQAAQHLLNRRGGGWPLTMFLTHDDHVPFAGGTYFPKEPRWGMPGFKDVLRNIAGVYRDRLTEIREQNKAVLDALQRLQPVPAEGLPALESAPLHAARADIATDFDAQLGGFGAAPKFPHPPMIERLLRHYAATAHTGDADAQALHMAAFTLRRMALGGIYDQLGGGFARYSVDAQWMIPHFEKMLYDNGPLLTLYCEAWLATREPLFGKVAQETADWAIRDMQSAEGGYYSSLDADSEGHEGKFYVWTREQVASVLSPAEYALFARHFGLDRGANFEGRWHLHVHVPVEELAAERAIPAAEAAAGIDAARARLLPIRNARIWPGRDEKILTSWNALMVKGMASAARALERSEYASSAERTLTFIKEQMWRDGRLLATFKDGRAHLNAYLDDYAFLIDAIVAFLQVRWRTELLEFARELCEVMLREFEDTAHGGFFFTAHGHEQLIQRSKSFVDEALPSGNGVAALALGRLGHLLGEPRYLDAAERTLRAAWPSVEAHPAAYLSLLAALEEWLQPPELIVIRGTGEAPADWARRALRHYAPRRLVFAVPSAEPGLPEVLAADIKGATPVAVVCEGTRCLPPLTALAALEAHLAKTEVRAQSS